MRAARYIHLQLSGATGLVYEVAWTRGLSLTLGSTTTAMSGFGPAELSVVRGMGEDLTCTLWYGWVCVWPSLQHHRSRTFPV
jgi:hypothetical protein